MIQNSAPSNFVAETPLARLVRFAGGLDGVAGFLLLAAIALAAALSPWLPLENPQHIDLYARFTPPLHAGHLLGTDALGRDIFSRLLLGARFSLAVALLSAFLGLAIGGTLGCSAGYAGGLWERFILRLADIFLSVPVMMLAILVIAVLGANQMHLIAVLALTSWVRFARIARAETLKLRTQTFILAARTLGASNMRVLFYHLLPALWPSMLTLGALESSRLLLMEASLSFLGLGAQPPAPAWGRMLADGRNYLTVAWWVTVMPGLAILLTVLAVTLLGSALRRRFEEQL